MLTACSSYQLSDRDAPFLSFGYGAGLGFDECAAKVSDIQDNQFAQTHSFVAEHELVGVKAWNFYAFNISQQDYQVVVNVAGETDNDDQCKLGSEMLPA